MKNADDEKSPGTSSEQASRRCGGVKRTSPCAASTRQPKLEQHALGVIARDRRLDHGRLTLRIQTGEQHRRLHLRAGDRQLVADTASALRRRGFAPAACRRCVSMLRAHLAQRRRDALHRPLHQRRVADQLAVEGLSGQQTRHQAHRGAGIAHVERVRRRLEPAHDRRRARALLRARSARSARRARAWRASSRDNLRFRESRAPR